MKRVLFYLLAILPAALMAQTQPQDSTTTNTTTVAPAPATFKPTALDRRLVEWSLSWLDTTTCDQPRQQDVLTDSLCRARLAALPCEIEMPYNAVVRQYINMYMGRPRQLAALKRMSEFYFPYFEDVLSKYGIPQELKYLAVIESALNASARSFAGAAGLWQFMPSTGKGYGLEVNSLIDERLDPYKSTEAACKFLKALYKVYGDWNLAIASYNCGPGNVNRAIHRAEGKTDFWSIYPYLPAETRSYLPCFIAATYALNYTDEHGICPDPISEEGTYNSKQLRMAVDTVYTDKRQHLRQTSEVLGIPLEELRKLNPQYIQDIIPGGKRYTIVLPIDYVGLYVDQEATILAYRADSLINNRRTEIETAQVTTTRTTTSSSSSSRGGKTYKVKKGDTLGGIAHKYHCTVAQLQKWNNLRGTTIQIGQVLKIKN